MKDWKTSVSLRNAAEILKQEKSEAEKNRDVEVTAICTRF
jgi:hypothetical protein